MRTVSNICVVTNRMLCRSVNWKKKFILCGVKPEFHVFFPLEQLANSFVLPSFPGLVFTLSLYISLKKKESRHNV